MKPDELPPYEPPKEAPLKVATTLHAVPERCPICTFLDPFHRVSCPNFPNTSPKREPIPLASRPTGPLNGVGATTMLQVLSTHPEATKGCPYRKQVIGNKVIRLHRNNYKGDLGTWFCVCRERRVHTSQPVWVETILEERNLSHMMRVVLTPLQTIGITFAHPEVDHAIHKDLSVPKRITHCRIFNIVPDALPTLLVDAVARTHHKDNFCRATGRKISLARALKLLSYAKDHRTKVWNTYFDHLSPTIEDFQGDFV